MEDGLKMHTTTSRKPVDSPLTPVFFIYNNNNHNCLILCQLIHTLLTTAPPALALLNLLTIKLLSPNSPLSGLFEDHLSILSVHHLLL